MYISIIKIEVASVLYLGIISMEEPALNKLKKYIKEKDFENVKNILHDIDLYALRYRDGETVLHWAAAFDNIKLCKYLLNERKFHINVSNFRGATALYYAACSDSENAAKVLLKYNADPCIRSGFSGMLPIQIAKSDNLKELLRIAMDKVPLEYENAYKGPFMKLDSTYIDAYRYRKYRWWLSAFDCYTNLYASKFGMTDSHNIDARELFKTQGWIAVIDKCSALYEEFLCGQAITERFNCCLACGKTEHLKQCSKCKDAKFCNEKCQKVAFIIHKWDCK